MFTVIDMILISGIVAAASAGATWAIVTARTNREDVDRLANLARYMSEEYKRES